MSCKPWVKICQSIVLLRRPGLETIMIVVIPFGVLFLALRQDFSTGSDVKLQRIILFVYITSVRCK